jgi:IKI3 family
MIRGNYRKAFLTCRKHRIDLNVIVDRNPKLFRERLSSFIEQVHDVDYINLFLTNLGSVVVSGPPTGADQGSQAEFAAAGGNI